MAEKPFRLRLPESFAATGDPVDGNPFPSSGFFHKVWSDATQEAEEEVARINSVALSSLEPSVTAPEFVRWKVAHDVARFDAWAKRGVKVVWSDRQMLSYDSWLVAYANARLEAAEADLASAPPEVPVEATLTYLRAQIAGRVEYWKAEARRHRAEQARYLAEQETQAQAPFAIPSSAPSSDVISRRKSWLKKYRSEKELSAEAFARKVGISETAIRGIVKEDRSRFADATRNKLLDVLGISLREWYGP